IFGPIGVVLAAMLVKSMDMEMLKWLVAFIVIYTSWTMYASWRAALPCAADGGERRLACTSAASALAPRKT
ncbi:MAG: hypothetical protein ACRC04_07070, partial [Aeromonas veronii]